MKLYLNKNKKVKTKEKKCLTYEALVVVAEPSEELIGGIEKGLTNQLKPLPPRPSPVQGYRKTARLYIPLVKLLLRTKQWKFKCFLYLPHPETQPRSSYSSQTQRSSA